MIYGMIKWKRENMIMMLEARSPCFDPNSYIQINQKRVINKERLFCEEIQVQGWDKTAI
jgi:hypothetical protein